MGYLDAIQIKIGVLTINAGASSPKLETFRILLEPNDHFCATKQNLLKIFAIASISLKLQTQMVIEPPNLLWGTSPQ